MSRDFEELIHKYKGSVLHRVLKDYISNSDQLTVNEHLIGKSIYDIYEKERNFFIDNDLTCSITQDILFEPVRMIYKNNLESEHAFEDRNAREWLKKSQTNPINREAVQKKVVPDKPRKYQIEKKLQECFKKYCNSLSHDESKRVNDAIKSVVLTILLIEAVRQNDLDIVRQHLGNDADINAKDQHGNTALNIAAQYGNIEIVKFLLYNEADVKIKDSEGRTALHFASYCGYNGITKYLLDNDANIDAKDNDLRTPLYYAVENEETEVVQYLLEHKANIDDRDHYGKTVLDLAREHFHLEILRLLKKEAELRNNVSNPVAESFEQVSRL